MELNLLIGVLIGFIGSVLATSAYDSWRKPNLDIKVGEIGDGERAGIKHRFLQIWVENKKRSSPPLPTKNTAYSCRAWIQFYDEKTNKELLKIDGRWSSNREPLVLIPSGTTLKTVPDISGIYIPPREDIPPSEAVQLAVGVKFEGDSGFYAFNNISYLFNWRNPDSRIEISKCLVKVTITSGEQVWTKKFRLANPDNAVSKFKLNKDLDGKPR